MFQRSAAPFLLGLGLFGLASLPAAAAPYTLVTLGQLSGDTISSAFGLNASGQSTGFSGTSTSPPNQVMLWSASGSATALGTAGGTGTSGRGNAINNAGTIVGNGFNASRVNSPFKIVSGTMTMLTPLAGSTNAGATAINSSGTIVGYSNGTGLSLRPVLRDPSGAVTDLGTLGGSSSSRAYGINDSGLVVGYSYTADGDVRAFAWTSSGGMKNLGALPDGSYSYALAANASGQIVGKGDDGNSEQALLWTSASAAPQVLAPLSGNTSGTALAINSSGVIAGLSSVDGSAQVATIWQNGTAIDLNSYLPAGSGWVLQQATGINDAGQIIGLGTYNGQTTAFLLTNEIPEPATAALLGAGLLGLGLGLRRRARG